MTKLPILFLRNIILSMATWWFGLILGIVIGAVGFVHKTPKRMFLVSMQSIFINLVVALVIGLTGLLYGYIKWGNVTRENLPNWRIPNDVIDFNNFVIVGSMHNFSYLGGILGLILAITWQIRNRKKLQ